MLRIADVLEVVGVSRSTLYKMIADGRFPRPMRVGQRAARWRQSDIQRWMDSLLLATWGNWR
ncbi:MAG: AlpA family phage regulatory protein [Chloroflexota bacterium]|nr:AlpA family phage regulatory protein [Chloroflexota bacterium]